MVIKGVTQRVDSYVGVVVHRVDDRLVVAVIVDHDRPFILVVCHG